MIASCYEPNGKYFNSEKIKVWEEWRNNFEKFYDDLLPLYKKAKKKYPTYKRRMKRGKKFENASDKLKGTHIYFTRIDKSEGYIPSNVCFTTPDWTMRYRQNSHRIIVGGKIKFIPEIHDEFNEAGKQVLESSIRQKVVEKKDFTNISDYKHYKYEGEYYTREEISDMFNIPTRRLTHFLRKYGEDAVQKALEYKEPSKIFYDGSQYAIYQLVQKIKTENKTELSEQVITGRVRLLREKKNKFTKKDVKNILDREKVEAVFISMGDKQEKLSDVCRVRNFPYKLAWRRYKRGLSIDQIFMPTRSKIST